MVVIFFGGYREVTLISEGIAYSAASIAAKEAAKKTVGACYDYLCNKHELVELRKFKKNYIDYCNKVLHIKTIASQDNSIFVDDVYVPISILKAGHSSPFDISEKTTLDDTKALLIKGLAGQGKSTILRKLLSNNAKLYDRLPIFYELKNYKGGSIEKAISKSLSAMGIRLNEHSIEKLIDDSSVKIYLDAFDEAVPKFRAELLDEIRKLINRYQCHVVCTTRPDTEIDSLTEVRTYTVCPLNERQIFGIIHSTSVDEEKAKELCSALERSPLHKGSESILKSPILVVLFCISYNLGEEIPSTLSQFYSNIFDTVFYRHDNVKGKVNRIRHWNDNRRIYRELFNCLCFISQRTGYGSFSKEKFSEFVAYSLEYVAEDSKLSDKISDEITTITNLIIEDGFNEYRYVHKSIQEFFSASFVCSMDHEKKLGFYKRCYEDHTFYSTFSNTLFFLNELDYYDYCDNFLVPSVSSMLNTQRKPIKDDFELPQELVKLFLDKMVVRSKFVKISHKSSKKTGYEILLEQPHFSGAEEFPEAYTRLFNFSISFIKLENENDELAKLIRERGETGLDNWSSLSLGNILSHRKVPLKVVKKSLLIGLEALFRKGYNEALKKLSNRNQALSSSGYFDF